MFLVWPGNGIVPILFLLLLTQKYKQFVNRSLNAFLESDSSVEVLDIFPLLSLGWPWSLHSGLGHLSSAQSGMALVTSFRSWTSFLCSVWDGLGHCLWLGHLSSCHYGLPLVIVIASEARSDGEATGDASLMWHLLSSLLFSFLLVSSFWTHHFPQGLKGNLKASGKKESYPGSSLITAII